MSFNDQTVHRVRRSKRPNRVRAFWTRYRVELIGSIIAAAGIFLVFEELNLRATLTTWIRAMTADLFRGYQNLDNQVATFLAQVSVSDLIGGVLIVGAVVAFLLRLRVRLLAAPALTVGACPKCGGPIHRIHRNWRDRVLCLYVPVRRYRCRSLACGWAGLRVGRHCVSASSHRHSPTPV